MPKTWADEIRQAPQAMVARRKRGVANSQRAGQRQPREADITRTQRRYRQRRERDLQWAVEMGVSQEFIETTGAQYVRGQ